MRSSIVFFLGSRAARNVLWEFSKPPRIVDDKIIFTSRREGNVNAAAMAFKLRKLTTHRVGYERYFILMTTKGFVHFILDVLR